MARKKKTSKAAPPDDVRPHPPEACAGGDVVVRLPPKLGKRLGEILAITDRFCDEHLDEEYKAQEFHGLIFSVTAELGTR